jgi:ribonucleoside-triphosphate reductase
MSTLNLSFRLPEAFLDQYKEREVSWGYTDAAGSSVGEITFLRTYSRLKEDGTKERWWEVCKRVIEGMFSIQKDECKAKRLPWSNYKAQNTAQDAFERLFTFKWTPPGRGLWMMGTPLVNERRNSAALQNCSFVSTEDIIKTNPSEPFAFLMEASMLGIGVGFDTKGALKNMPIFAPSHEGTFVIPDSREGWVDSLSMVINAYLIEDRALPEFDYSEIRPKGTPIKTFGGVAEGPEPLMKLHDTLQKVFNEKIGGTLDSRLIADIGNLIGVCVVSGNVRRSAELLIGDINDDEFLGLKDYAGAGASRAEWSWMSNNSVFANVGDDLSKIIPGIAQNGEPGVIWMDTSRKYGRLADPVNNKDRRAAGYNPCAEQTLESYECCTLVETYLNRHESLDDYKKTLKVAYLYAKTVTLLPTHWQRTNAIMQRNRRIGTSMSGIANFADRNGLPVLREWMDKGYKEIQRLDVTYSEWLCVRESIKTTTVKPSGTVSILAGESPGVHWSPGGEYFNRAIRFGNTDPMVTKFRKAGYTVENDVANPDTTVVVYFPIHSLAKRSEHDVTLYEKASLAATAQEWWSDNSVSVTLSFDPEREADHVGNVLGMYDGKLKTVSFLPMLAEGAYAQMPYTGITEKEYKTQELILWPVDLSSIYNGGAEEAEGEAYCTTDACEITTFVQTAEASNDE